MPDLPIPRGMVDASFLAHIAVAKLFDHLPLYRQAEIYARIGLDIDRTQLAAQLGQVVWLLPPLGELIADHGIAGRVIHDPAGARTGSRQGQDRPDFFVIPRTCGYCFPRNCPFSSRWGAFDCWNVTETSTAAHLGDRVIVKFAIANSTDPWQQIKTARIGS